MRLTCPKENKEEEERKSNHIKAGRKWVKKSECPIYTVEKNLRKKAEEKENREPRKQKTLLSHETWEGLLGWGGGTSQTVLEKG
jgi:hypothetical protein